MAAKHQIITKSQFKKVDSEQLEQSFLLLQDEIFRKNMELLQQNHMIKKKTWSFIKKSSE